MPKTMKNYYKINEISKLYGIGPDSLRYYEKLGSLKPRRDTNGYRLYSLKDIYKLNVIRDLRRLSFPMEKIREYLDHQSVSNTLELLKREQELLSGRISELQNRTSIIQERISVLTAAQSVKTGQMKIRTLPERRCVELSEPVTRDEEMDFIIKKLHRKHEDKISDFGGQSIGAFLSLEDLKKGISNVYHSVFFVLGDDAEEYDFTLAPGEYLSCFYRGGYMQNAERMQEILSYLARKGLTMAGDPFEMYEVDNRDTILEEEFLTEIQVRIKSL